MVYYIIVGNGTHQTIFMVHKILFVNLMSQNYLRNMYLSYMPIVSACVKYNFIFNIICFNNKLFLVFNNCNRLMISVDKKKVERYFRF